MTGPPGSGKSTLRRRLAGMLGGTSIDIVDFYPDDASFDLRDAQLAFSKLTSRLKDHDQGFAIVEAMFYQRERRETIELLAAKRGADVAFVHLDAELNCLQARVANRRDTFMRALTGDRVRQLKARFGDYRPDLAFRTDQVAVDEAAAQIERYARRWTDSDRRTA